MRNSALATAALTSVALLSQTASATPATGDDGPSREEVQQRIDNLYNRAETDTGTFNATRAAAGPRQRAGSPADTGRGAAGPVTDGGRGRVDAGTDNAPRRQADPAIGDVARQWFDVARAKLGPTVQAALPADRRQARPAVARPARPVTAPGIPAQATAERSAPELTAGSAPALPSAPVTQAEAQQEAAPRALPSTAVESGQSSLRTSKERIQRQLATARDLLTARTAQAGRPSTSLTAIESGPAEDLWAAPAPETRLDPDPRRQQQQPTAMAAPLTMQTPYATGASPSMDSSLATGTSLTMDPSLTTGTSFAMDPSLTTGTSLTMDPSLTPNTPFAPAAPPTTNTSFATEMPFTTGTSFATDPSLTTGTAFGTASSPATDASVTMATPPPMGAQLTPNTLFATNPPLMDGSLVRDASITSAPATTAAPLPTNTPLPAGASLTFAAPVPTATPTAVQPSFGTTAPFPPAAPFQADGTSGAGIPLAPAAPAPVGLPQAPEAPAYEPKAFRALAFARAQIGKPCVWGAAGPGSYDNAGLTQAAWRAAGVDLPRATPAQAASGTPVALADTRVGDLVFFYDDLSHVGLYIGNGTMIHAPGPGAYIREESVFYAGESAIRGAVRPV
ncbi:NlpC/P60 family protein [Streptomyces sp. NPDC058678]|uniref:C40 family peptidase n=1 Tax=Streptomyces sp. NPDC058678 TaxID=3346595 RepID=UPI00365E9470